MTNMANKKKSFQNKAVWEEIWSALIKMLESWEEWIKENVS